MKDKKIAVLYQADLPPTVNGIQKPMKPGGYSDSGADIAYALKMNNSGLICPVDTPAIDHDLDWVFPDSINGIQAALNKGATTFWLNTVLYATHPITSFYDQHIQIIGQNPAEVDRFDDKFYTNALLKKNQLPIPKSTLISLKGSTNYELTIDFPLVVKPIRGRGSQGVYLAHNKQALDKKLSEFSAHKEYGDSIYVEAYLSGQEITLTVMPPGNYQFGDKEIIHQKPWCLPAVKRFNHDNGIAPYNGVVAVINNSAVLSDDELGSEQIRKVTQQCAKAAELVHLKAPIRIDCRADEKGNYYLFDLNMKPNMTGPSRPHRQDQDSLSLLAARKIGWSYIDLLKNMVGQAWQGRIVPILTHNCSNLLNLGLSNQPDLLK